MSPRSCSVDLTLDLAAPHAARTLVALLLRHWGVLDANSLDGAAIVVTELVTNALVHGDDGGPVRLELELREEGVRIAVVDRHPGVPAQRVANTDAEGGRGIAIVAQLAHEWGVEPAPEGKRVYAHLPLPESCA